MSDFGTPIDKNPGSVNNSSPDCKERTRACPHECINQICTHNTTEEERATHLIEWVDPLRNGEWPDLELMPLREDKRGPIIRGRCKLDSEEARSLLVTPEEAARRIREEGVRGFYLYDAGESPCDNRREHRGQFVGATFGAIALSGKTIAATDNHDIRFDHAQFQTENDNLDFSATTFETQGQYPVSFFGAKFITKRDGDVWFGGATFRTKGDGDVRFSEVTFQSGATGGSVGFGGVVIRANGDVRFDEAMFQTHDTGDVRFDKVTVWTTSTGNMRFDKATFQTNATGNIQFGGATLVGANFREVDFGEADLRGTTLTGADLREADVAELSVTGATTCKRLYEGYGATVSSTSPSTVLPPHSLNIIMSLL